MVHTESAAAFQYPEVRRDEEFIVDFHGHKVNRMAMKLHQNVGSLLVVYRFRIRIDGWKILIVKRRRSLWKDKTP